CEIKFQKRTSLLKYSSQLLSNTEFPEDDVQQILHVDPAGDAANGSRGQAEILRQQLRPGCRQRPRQAFPALIESESMARARQGWALAKPRPLDNGLRQCRQQAVNTHPGTHGDREGRAAAEVVPGRTIQQVALVYGKQRIAVGQIG